MKKDKLKELFEANEIKNLHRTTGGLGGGSSSSNVSTNESCTEGDEGCCDSDSTSTTDHGEGGWYEGRDHVSQID